MHHTHLNRWQHSHSFALDTSVAERRTRIVIVITAIMMVVEIAAGTAFNSMALLADGWHMSTHVAAFLITALAYYFSRRHSADPRYTFGTGKMGVLGGFGSSVVAVWAYGLVRDTSGNLLDRTPESTDLPDEIRRTIESDVDAVITDLHIWQLGAGHFAAIVSVVAHDPKPAADYCELLREHEELVHVTVQVQHCQEHESSPVV